MDRREFILSVVAPAAFDAARGGDNYRDSYDGYLWATKKFDGGYHVAYRDIPAEWRGVTFFEVDVADTIMHRRMNPNDRCLLRHRPGGVWEVVMRHQP